MLNLVYRPPNGDHKELENYFKSPVSKREISHKDVILAGDFNINLLDFDTNKKVQNFVNLMSRFGMTPTINKPMPATRQTASAIDHIITDSIMHNGFKSGIIKTVISGHFPILFCCKYIAEKEDTNKEFIYKRRFSDQSIRTFKVRLRDINWSKVRQCRNANEAYINFFNIVDLLYDECFPVAKIRLKQKKHFTPWITKGIKKSSKRKQKLYEKFLKQRTILNEEKYKAYKNLFESIKRTSKKSYFSKKILQYKNNMKKTWSFMKEIIRKMHQHNKSKLPRKLFADKKYITLEKEIAKKFN